jgi:N-acetylneuraminic acid mutarotase
MKKQIAPSAKAYLIRSASCLFLVVSVSAIPFAFGQWRAGGQKTLTFAERVVYQRAIEEVYWRHRIWPKERPDPKPSLDAVMSQAQLEKKAADYLRNSQALEDYWQRPITAEQLQAEMDRMATHTKQPEILRELFDALGNDPFVIAECLARPALAERLLKDWYVYDQRFHRELKKHAEADLQGYNTIKQMRQTSGSYDEIEFIRSDSAQDVVDHGASHGVKLNSVDWEETVQRLGGAFKRSDPVKASALGVRRDVAAEYRALPLGKLSPLREDETRYYVTAVIEKTDKHLKLATIAWRKEPLHSWLVKAEKQVPVTMAAGSANYTLPVISGNSDNSIPSVACTADTWTPTDPTNVPDPRSFPTAVWTGSEMIVWGGYPQLNTGGRYNPSTDSWIPTSTVNAPAGRYLHTAVWTGSEMIIWGGVNGSNVYFNTGGKYNPSTDSWTATSRSNAPDRRVGHTAVWTGSEMIVWGGYFYDGIEHFLNTGGKYNPSTDSWTATSGTSAPAGRRYHTAVWTGSEMIVWGGGEPYLNTGGRYSPITDSWTITSTTNAPSGREVHTAVWTGTEMIVWSGLGLFGDSNTGGRYNPSTDSWTPTSLTNVPIGRDSHTAVWTGDEMIVWGGSDLNTGGRYDPGTDSWTATSLTEAPDPRYRHTAVWTGSEMIVWGGLSFPAGFLNTGGRYDPSSDSWTATSTTSAATGRYLHTAVWTGSEMIIWGGLNAFGGYLNTGGRYNPSTDNWVATNTSDAPVAREFHTAVWTGSEMIIWGGEGTSSELNTGSRCNPSSISGPPPTPTPTPVPFFNTGARYNPDTDSWTATSTANAPAGRYIHTAVWNGSEMIVWGGVDTSFSETNTGGRYDPSTDTWTATSITNAPAGRSLHTAVWAGSEMIVWGGGACISGCSLNTGGRYNPSNDSWIATSTTNAPAVRFEHTAVWSGSEMIVWGGRDGFVYYDTGGRYTPGTDSWTATSTTDAPAHRAFHAGVWTGSEMIVWGGYDGFSFLDTGGRYNPLIDSWTATSTTGAPTARDRHTAVWTGGEMIVWGGEDVNNSFPITGGRYCAQSAAPTPTPTPSGTPRVTPRPRPTPHPRP